MRINFQANFFFFLMQRITKRGARCIYACGLNQLHEKVNYFTDTGIKLRQLSAQLPTVRKMGGNLLVLIYRRAY